MLEFENISKHYGDHVALDGLSLSIPRAKTTVLIGPSGCGKSTLIKLIVGLIEPDSGTISLEDRPLISNNMEAIRHSIGYVIQDGGLFPHLTARENVVLLASYLKWNTDKVENRLEELCRLLQFPRGLLKRYPQELSGGQQQRVSLMRALMLDPEILLMDEPLAALDPMIRYELQLELKNIFDELNKTVILVTHDMGEAAYLGDIIVLMQKGKIIQQGELKTLMQEPAEPFVEQFIQAQQHHWLLMEEVHRA